MTNVPVRPLRRVEYDLLVERGMFDEGERVQLLEGELIEMSPQGVAHAALVEALTQLLVPALVGRARVRVQLPFAAGDASEPEPDVAVVSTATLRDRHPDTALLVVEVADTSLPVDLGVKARLYAKAAVPRYWVIDTTAGVTHVHTDPGPDGYASVSRHAAAHALEAPELGITVKLSDLLDA